MKRAGNDLTLDEAGQRVQELLLDTVLALARIKVFRSTNRQAVEHGRQLFEDESQKFLLELQKDGIIGSPEIVTSPEARRDFCRNYADTQMRDCRVVADAATLVFVHSLLDIHTTDCLEILIGFHPPDWRDCGFR
jgi:hypothetical protein